jgi:hypothetical protein
MVECAVFGSNYSPRSRLSAHSLHRDFGPTIHEMSRQFGKAFFGDPSQENGRRCDDGHAKDGQSEQALENANQATKNNEQGNGHVRLQIKTIQ